MRLSVFLLLFLMVVSRLLVIIILWPHWNFLITIPKKFSMTNIYSDRHFDYKSQFVEPPLFFAHNIIAQYYPRRRKKERNDCFAVITLLQNHRTRRPAYSYLHCSFNARNSLKYNFLVLGRFIKHFHRANCLVYPFYQTKGINVFFRNVIGIGLHFRWF